MISVEEGSPAVVLKLSSGSGLVTGITSIDMLKYIEPAVIYTTKENVFSDVSEIIQPILWSYIEAIIKRSQNNLISDLYLNFMIINEEGAWLLVVPSNYCKYTLQLPTNYWVSMQRLDR